MAHGYEGTGLFPEGTSSALGPGQAQLHPLFERIAAVHFEPLREYPRIDQGQDAGDSPESDHEFSERVSNFMDPATGDESVNSEFYGQICHQCGQTAVALCIVCELPLCNDCIGNCKGERPVEVEGS